MASPRSLFYLSSAMVLLSVSGLSSQEANDTLAPENAISNLELYPGVSASLFASEPMISSVTNLDIDHRGRVWVCEVMNYREHRENGTRPEGDRILILEDVDGDGVADTSKTYYQGRDVDAALGICVLGNQVIVSCAPNIIVFTDEDGDDVPDRKEYLFTNTGEEQDDHSSHSFIYGPDGKLYWNMGNHGQFVHDSEGKLVTDKAGNLVFDRRYADNLPDYDANDTPYIGGMIFRCNPDGSEFEVLAHNFRNNYEVAIDSFGGLWQSDNDDDGNFGVRLNYILEYGNYGYRDEITLAYWNTDRVSAHPEIPKKHWHQNDPGVVPNFVQTGAGSPTAITVYEGDLLPEIFHNQVIHCEAGPGVVWAAIAEPDGAGFKGHMVNLLKEAKRGWVKPVDPCTAPDGSLFVTDWYDPVVSWNRQWDVPRGRIYRLAPKDHKYQVQPAKVNTPAQAAEALKSPNSDVRYLARQALIGFNIKDSILALNKIYNNKNPRIQARALWLLAELEGDEKSTLKKALKDSNPDIRVTAIRAARQQATNLVEILNELIHDRSARVRSEVAIALRNLDDVHVPDIWAQLAKKLDPKDRWNLEALGIAADGRWDACLNAWFAAGGDWDSSLGRKIIWRSRARQTPELLTQCLQLGSLSEEETRLLIRAFDFQPDSEAKQEALRQLAYDSWRSQSENGWLISSEAFQRLRESGFSNTTVFNQQLDLYFENAPKNEAYLKLVSSFGKNQYFTDILDLVVNGENETLQMAATRALLNARQQGLITERISNSGQKDRGTIVHFLAESRDDFAIPVLKEVLLDPAFSIKLRKRATHALGISKAGPPILVEMAKAGVFPEELKQEAGTAIVQTTHVNAFAEAGKYFPLPQMKGDANIPGMTDLVVMQGNKEAGKKVFQEATCATCHQVNGEGINFGPDLSGIGAKFEKTGLFEAVLNPSAAVSESYQTATVVLKDGTSTTGLLNNETDREISLQLPGGVQRNYPRSTVTNIEKLNQSLMPIGLQRLMTVNDLADLVEYLSSLK
jgi:putative membrane-bound dehydrogenase-like protein